MTPQPPQQQWPRGPHNELHDAAECGCVKHTVALLSGGSIDINQGSPRGWTALMYAALAGQSHIVRVLLNKGAESSIVNDDGVTALLISAHRGDVVTVKMLLKSGADIAVTDPRGSGVLHLAAGNGHWEVMRVLIEAGANIDSRKSDGETPLYLAAKRGYVGVITGLLGFKADPLLTTASEGADFIAVEVAAAAGHTGVVQELVRKLGIGGCGGKSRGEYALRCAVAEHHLDIMAILLNAGVVDTGATLSAAARLGSVASVKFLLQRQKRSNACCRHAYVNNKLGLFGATPLFESIRVSHPCSPRIVRLLMDAGADTTSDVQVTAPRGESFSHTPLGFISRILMGLVSQEISPDRRLQPVMAIHRLLLQVDAVHAVSWLWPSRVAKIRRVDKIRRSTDNKTGTETTPMPLGVTFPTERRSAGRRRRVLLPAMLRWVVVMPAAIRFDALCA